MSKRAGGDRGALARLAQQAARWIEQRQKDFDLLSGILDKMDGGQAILKRERQRARSALKRLQQ